MNDERILKTPCPGCPFGYHKDAVLYLSEERLQGIVETEGVFPCHRTVEDTGGPRGDEQRVCTGWLVYQLTNGTPGQAVQVFGRLGWFDEDEMLEANQELVVTDWEELLERHRSGGK